MPGSWKNRLIPFIKWLATTAVIVAGLSYWTARTGYPDGIWAAIGGAAGCLMAYFIIMDLFVTPLQNQIAALGLKIDALSRQIDHDPQ